MDPTCHVCLEPVTATRTDTPDQGTPGLTVVRYLLACPNGHVGVDQVFAVAN